MQLRGVAQLHGEHWAQAVARVCQIDRAWPFMERRAIAIDRALGRLADYVRSVDDDCPLCREIGETSS